MRLRLAWATVVFFALVSTGAIAQGGVCGDAPPVEDGSIKGEIDGKADFLKKYVGIGLKGQVEIAKNDVLSRYPNADVFHLNRYFLYVVCLQIMNDQKLSTPEKIKELKGAREAIFPPKSSTEKMRERHSYIGAFPVDDQLLAAAIIEIGEARLETDYSILLSAPDLVSDFGINPVLASAGLEILQKRGFVTFRARRGTAKAGSIDDDDIKFASGNYFSLTKRGFEYAQAKRLVR